MCTSDWTVGRRSIRSTTKRINRARNLVVDAAALSDDFEGQVVASAAALKPVGFVAARGHGGAGECTDPLQSIKSPPTTVSFGYLSQGMDSAGRR